MTPEAAALAILGGALVLYSVTGGADFGAGLVELLAWGPRKDEQRALVQQEIGPVWEANHVWFIFLFVVLFTGFPGAFSVIVSGLFGPLTLYAVGIVLRGGAFTFRHYDEDRARKRTFGTIFALASVLCPFLLGAMGARLISDAPLSDRAPTAFSLASGAFVTTLFGALAASYLAVQARDGELRKDFRRRGAALLVLAGALSFVSLGLSTKDAPRLVANVPWPAIALAPVLGLAALVASTTDRPKSARALTASTTALVVVLFGLGLGDRLAPGCPIATTKAHPETLRFVVSASLMGAVLLFPSLVILFRVFHASERISDDGGGTSEGSERDAKQ